MNTLHKYRYFLLIIPILIIIALFVPKCSNKPKPLPLSKDTLVYNENEINKELNKVLNEHYLLKLAYDSLKSRKPILVIKYKTKYDSLILADTSCQNSLIMLYNSFGELNDLNDSIIAKADKRLKNDSIAIDLLNDKISLNKQRIFIDSCYIARLQDTLPKLKRKAFWRGFKLGFGSGAVVTEVVNGAILLKH